MSEPEDQPATGADNEKEMVITPGGPRPKDNVHPVGPGQAVRRNQDGSYSVVRETPPSDGEKEESKVMAEEYVLTPGGYRLKSLVHPIETGHTLDGTGGRMRSMDAHGKLVAELGEIPVKPGDQPLMPHNVLAVNPAQAHVAGAKVPALKSGWITYADWTNSTGKPITSFKTTWAVPPNPATHHNQTIFLFNGIQNSTMIYQPVLQWGPSAAGGGAYWAVASWYADGQSGHSYHSGLTKVKVGQILVGVMTETGKTGSNFNYDCIFQGIPGSNLPITNVQQLTWCIETLEAYSCQVCSDYPAGKTKMYAIEIKTSGHPTLHWTAVNAVTDCSQHTIIVSNANPGGEVDLYY